LEHDAEDCHSKLALHLPLACRWSTVRQVDAASEYFVMASLRATSGNVAKDSVLTARDGA